MDGEGARRFGGRWNAKGTPVVYTSSEPALAVLEYFVNLEIEDAPGDLVMVAADVPGPVRVETVDAPTLPRAWRTTPPPAALARLGTSWADAKRAAVLAVPSAVVPVQRNYLLNPRHPDFEQIRVARAERISLDPRMWKAARSRRGR
jgi:RES domain-containing protein